MASSGSRDLGHQVLRPLEIAGLRRRDRVSRIGLLAYDLAQLARAGLPVPRGWVLGAEHFAGFAGGRLPRGLGLRSLIKLSHSRAGHDRCARAYELLLTEPLPGALVEAVAALWEAEAERLPLGVAVRPSLAFSEGRTPAAVAGWLPAVLGAAGPDAIVAAIRQVWAGSVLSRAVAAFAAAELKDVAIAVVVQQAVPIAAEGVLQRARAEDPAGEVKPPAAAPWSLRARPAATPLGRHRQVLLPLGPAAGAPAELPVVASADRPLQLPELLGALADPPHPLRALCTALGPVDGRQLSQLGERAERQLGTGAAVRLAVDPDGGLHVLSAEPPVRHKARPVLGDGDETTIWSELTLSGSGPEPPTSLTKSVIDSLVLSSVEATVAAMCKTKLPARPALIASYQGRSYLDLAPLLHALADVPLLEPGKLLYATGGGAHQCLQQLADQIAAEGSGRGLIKPPFIAATIALQQLRLDQEVATLEQGIARDARAAADLDLTILPDDAMATTLAGAQALLERCGELWLRCVAGQLVYTVGVHSLVVRRIPQADPRLGYTLATGVSGVLLPSLVEHLRQLAAELRRDPEAHSWLLPAGSCAAADLPDGAAREVLGQLVARYGDLATWAFELSRPRWREDAGALRQMLGLLIRRGADELPPVVNARAFAEAELGRYEPELSPMDRRLVRSLTDRCKNVIRQRVTVDRWLFRTLALLRQVVCDIDRRLRRLDSRVPPGGAFHCSSQRLAVALRSGRPELGRLVRMRLVERRLLARQALPPLCFVGSPPRDGITLEREELRGLGVSPGVVEGPARVLGGGVPAAVAPDEILVTAVADPCLLPVYTLASALVCEDGGALSLTAEGARECGLPTVMSATGATLRIRSGDRLRIDGERGTVALVRPAAAPAGQPLP